MSTCIKLACDCGAVQIQAANLQDKDMAHIACHCRDCRAGVLAVNETATLEGPVSILHTTQDKLDIIAGADTLGIIRVSPRGLYRWYATCCGTALFATPGNHRVPFVGLSGARIDADLGPISTEAFIPHKSGKTKHKGGLTFLSGLLARMGRAWISGDWRKSPLFDHHGKPIAKTPPRTLTRAELSRLKKR